MRFFLFFRFSPVSFIPPVSFSLLFVIGLLRPPCAHLFHAFSSSTKRRTFPHQASVAAHEAIPSCSFAHSFSAMASICFTLFTSPPALPSAMTITIFLTAHLPVFRLWSPSFPTHPSPSPVPVSQKQPRILKLELELDDRRCRVDFSTFNFHYRPLPLNTYFLRCE